MRTWGHEDMGTCVHGDMRTWGHGDMWTWGRGIRCLVINGDLLITYCANYAIFAQRCFFFRHVLVILLLDQC